MLNVLDNKIKIPEVKKTDLALGKQLRHFTHILKIICSFCWKTSLPQWICVQYCKNSKLFQNKGHLLILTLYHWYDLIINESQFGLWNQFVYQTTQSNYIW
jgi:hypothetical protein